MDYAGEPTMKSGLGALLVTLFVEATETVSNDVGQKDRMTKGVPDESYTAKLNGEGNVNVHHLVTGSGKLRNTCSRCTGYQKTAGTIGP